MDKACWGVDRKGYTIARHGGVRSGEGDEKEVLGSGKVKRKERGMRGKRGDRGGWERDCRCAEGEVGGGGEATEEAGRETADVLKEQMVVGERRQRRLEERLQKVGVRHSGLMPNDGAFCIM